MRKVKRQTHKHASAKKHTSKKSTFLLFHYTWVALVGLLLLLCASLFAVHYATTGKVLSAITGPTGGCGGSYCNNEKAYCTEKKSTNGTCQTSCLFTLGKCGYKFPTPKPTPKPAPKDTRLQSLKCTSKTYPYQIFAPEAYGKPGGSYTTNTNLTGKITASICTDEIYEPQYKQHAVRITTNIVFDQLAINAGVTCEGPGSYPISNHDRYNYYHTYQPIGQGALAVYYLNGVSDSTTPDARTTVSCPGGKQLAAHHLAFQFSPDVSGFNNIYANKGDTYQGRLVFTLNFHEYGYKKDIDIWSNTIKVK